jgi:hypothetical protein
VTAVVRGAMDSPRRRAGLAEGRFGEDGGDYAAAGAGECRLRARIVLFGENGGFLFLLHD